MPFSDGDEDYTEFPAHTIGGPSGDYSLQCDVQNGEWAEFIIQCIANGSGGVSTVFVSGDSKAPTLKYDGTASAKMDDAASAMGYAYSLVANTTQPDPMGGIWERITHSQRKIFVRIDAAASTSCYVTARFRIRKLKYVPPYMGAAVHPNRQEQANIARADTIRERLNLEQEIEAGESMNASPQRAKTMKELLRGQR